MCINEPLFFFKVHRQLISKSLNILNTYHKILKNKHKYFILLYYILSSLKNKTFTFVRAGQNHINVNRIVISNESRYKKTKAFYNISGIISGIKKMSLKYTPHALLIYMHNKAYNII